MEAESFVVCAQDYRRTFDYDSNKLVDQYLNQQAVKVML